MQQRTTVMLVASDPALFRDAAVTLGVADYHIIGTSSVDVLAPDLILKHWAETSTYSHLGPVPVLTLDLSLVSGADLVSVVDRGLGRRATVMSRARRGFIEYESSLRSSIEADGLPRGRDSRPAQHRAASKRQNNGKRS